MTSRMSSRTSKPIPTPVAAALGIVPTLLDGARRIPGKAVVLPVLAVSIALNTLETVKKEYDELAERGERLVTRLLGGSSDEPADRVEDAVAAPGTALQKVTTAASPEVVATVEAVAASVTAPEVTAHSQLPLPDYDHMTLGSLRGRLRSLTVSELVQVRDYEKDHGHRLPVITLLDHRIAKLAHDAAAAPAPEVGDVVRPVPEAKRKVTKATAPRKSAPRPKVRAT